jgi:GNAT superfamily N-acetyltransferase
MPESETNNLPDPIAIARLEERRQAFGVASLADAVEESMGGTLCSSSGDTWINKARGIGLDGAVSDAELDGLVSFYEDRGQRAKAELCPFAHPTLVEGLGERGFVVRAFLTNWAIGLGPECAAAEPVGGWPSGIETRAVDAGDTDAIGAWARLLSDGFEAPGTGPHRANTAFMINVARQAGVLCIGAFEGIRLVGAAAVEVSRPTGGDAVAGLFSASVRDGWRGRGIQQALICERLRAASELGATLACIESMPGIATERNARRLGFVPVYTKAIVARQAIGPPKD